MGTLRSLSSQNHGQCVYQQPQHAYINKKVVARYNSNHVFYTKNVAALVSCSFQDSSLTSLLSSKSPSQKSENADGFMRNKSVIDVSLVNGMVKEFTDNSLFEDAVRVYLDLLECGYPVAEFKFFPTLLKAFGGLCDANKGKEIHGQLLKLGFLEDVYVSNSLLGMYWKCEAVGDAVKMFEKMHVRDLVSWNTMISWFSQLGEYIDSLMYFRRMVKEHGVLYPNRVSCLSVLSSCASRQSLIHGREIHGFIMKNGLDSDEFFVSALIALYMKCGDVNNAEHVFKRNLDEDRVRGNCVVWTVMISGYVLNECLSLALDLFVEMLESGVKPDSSTVVAALVLCSRLLDLEVGRQTHGIIIELGLENDVRVGTALLEMYFNCGDPQAGLKVFKGSDNHNLVMWGSVILNCAQNGYPNHALQLFYDFMSDSKTPDSVILLASLRACSSLALKPRGMEIHGLAVKLRFDSDVFVGGALVDLYGKCGDIESAQLVFCGLPIRDLIVWNALISGLAQNEFAVEALKAFRGMQSDTIKPNTVTLASILSVCSQLSVMIHCKEAHCYLLRHGFETNILVNNSLISAYAKCGAINSSWTVFEKMPSRNEVSWNSIILGFGMHGCTDEIFALFEQMKEAGMKPDQATFTALLSACSHSGKVEMGWKYLNSMVEDYNLEPQVEQYTCMVDLLGRAGLLNEAYNLILAIPCSPDDSIWGSLLGSCKIHGDEKLAGVVGKHIFELDPKAIGYRVLLASLYEGSGKMDEVTRVRLEIEDVGLKKQPGCSWIEVSNKIHTFTAGDYSHNQSENIYAVIKNLTLEMKRLGYIPCI